jgi:hypothetical protein|tara:strand:+ start:2743 stop:3258 length:516 start_codon:yes stop_codon:yes gene_type:complete
VAKPLKPKTTKNKSSPRKARSASVIGSIQKANGKRFVDGKEYNAKSPGFNIKRAEKSLTTATISDPQGSAENVLSILGVTFEESDRDYSFLQEVTNEKIADKTAWEETKNERIAITDKFPDEADNIFKPDKSISQAASKAIEKQAPKLTLTTAQTLASDFIKHTKRLPQIK